MPLGSVEQLPTGAEVDARHGTIKLTAASTDGPQTQTGQFGGAIFRITQDRGGGGLTTLTLLEGLFPGAPGYAGCRGKSAGARPEPGAPADRRVLQTLHSTAHGHFRSRGRFSAATVRGTIWDMEDRCDGTWTRVHRGTVIVHDFVRHTDIIVPARHQYLAKAPIR
jgi:hypothetical protein